jgi:hypothetical protein
LIAGTSVDLTPSVGAADPGVTWSVDGVVGGNAVVGTISSGGLYIAPGAVPSGGSVTIRATLDADPSVFDDVEISILPVPNGAPEFVDVDRSSWYGPSVIWMAEQGITTGTSPTTFSPDREVTRAEAVTLLWRWMGEPAAGPSPFTDVWPGAFYADAVAWAAEVGVIVGTSETTFEPDSTMTRVQLATVFHRLAGSPDALGPPPFGDVQLGRYFTVPVAWMAENALTTGVATGVFLPYGVVTRAQVSTVLCRFSASPSPYVVAPTAVCDLT